MKKLVAIFIAMMICCAAFARMPMYGGALMGFDGYSYDSAGFGTFAIEAHYGLRPIDSVENLAFEGGLKFVFEDKDTLSDKTTMKASGVEIITRAVYDFKPLSALPELNFFVSGGIGIQFIDWRWDGVYGSWAEGKETLFSLPVGGGVKYQILDNLEGVLQTEVGLGEALEFYIAAGVNYKF